MIPPQSLPSPQSLQLHHTLATRVAGGTMRTRSLIVVLLASATTLGVAARAAADLSAQVIAPYGGSTGTSFTRGCGADHVMTGLRVRYGALVDAVGLLCRPVNADGSLGTESAVGTMVGGTGGTATSVRCPAGSVVAGGKLYAFAPPYPTMTGFTLSCRNWVASGRRFGTTSTGTLAIGALMGTTSGSMCAQQVQPMVGIRGRSGAIVDALGFTCDEP
jgi:hypothetical protein